MSIHDLLHQINHRIIFELILFAAYSVPLSTLASGQSNAFTMAFVSQGLHSIFGMAWWSISHVVGQSAYANNRVINWALYSSALQEIPRSDRLLELRVPVTDGMQLSV